jgi:hypothetical protein
MGVAVTVGTVGISEGSIDISVITSNNRPIAVGSVTDLAQSTQTTVATVPANGVKYITKVICSGNENGLWQIYLDSVLKVTKRTTDRQVDFDFNLPMKQLATEVLDVKVTHFGPAALSDFQCTVLGYTVS